MSRICPTCGCIEACYQDEHAADELTTIPDDWMEAGIKAVSKYAGTIIRPESVLMRELVEDVHRAMHGREPLLRRADRDFTKSGLERSKT